MDNTARKTYRAAGSYNLATYYRISVDDGRNAETLSITNQRSLVTSFISKHEDFSSATITEYIDDGISGTNTNREAYKRLITDMEQGAIDCIVVKDLSRIGRNLIDVDDLLMNHLVTLNVRFVAINNGYDSLTSPLSNLELAMVNLANQHYAKDLGHKSITARNVKSKAGEYLGGNTPFGYKKSDTEKNKLVPDKGSADYVRLIFSLACEGTSAIDIAQILNAQGVPSPLMYRKQEKPEMQLKSAVDPDYFFWTHGTVGKLIKNEVYIGSVIANKVKIVEPSSKRTVKRPREEWIVAENVHEPLVSQADFIKARKVLSRTSDQEALKKIFVKKVKCLSCGHVMTWYNKVNPRFKCGTRRVTDHYGCKAHSISQRGLEEILLKTIKSHLEILIDNEEVKMAEAEKTKATSRSLEGKISNEQRAIATLEASITKIFTSLATGKITQEIFVQKKGVINETVERKQGNIQQWQEQLDELTTSHDQSEKAIRELTTLRSMDKLDREMIDLLIDKILIHAEDDVEIIWHGTFEK